MSSPNKLDQVFEISKDVVVREIEGELIIVPIIAGIGDMENELYTMNDTGKEILARLDGKTSLANIALALSEEYNAPSDEIEKDILGLINELEKRKMIINVY